MRWIRAITVIGLLLIAVLTGGTIVRIGSLTSTPPAIVTLAFVGLLVLIAVFGASRGGAGPTNPYW